jgi:hypothetical protein
MMVNVMDKSWLAGELRERVRCHAVGVIVESRHGRGPRRLNDI